MKMVCQHAILGIIALGAVRGAVAFPARARGVPPSPRRTGRPLRSSRDDDAPPPPPLATLVRRVAVAGATGRTGQRVVRGLLARDVPVLALVRDVDKAAGLFGPADARLAIRRTDLGSTEDVTAAVSEGECDAAIWAATGFSDAPDQSFLTKIMAVLGFATNAAGSIDAVGLPALGKALAATPPADPAAPLPRVVMLSSAGVTRPEWSEEKQRALEGCAGIPIVRLNPFGILGVKLESERQLRRSGECAPTEAETTAR